MPMILTEGVSPASQPLGKAVFVPQGTAPAMKVLKYIALLSGKKKKTFSVLALPFEQLSWI